MFSLRKASILVAATALTAAAGITFAAPASAEDNPNCSSVTQIGTTGYAHLNGATVASIKQFKGCGKNWGYVYVWSSFRATHTNNTWSACTSIMVGNTVEDYNCAGNGQAEAWSLGSNTLTDCTRAVGGIQNVDGETGGNTDTRC
jgi:hypothetical protein